MTNLAANSTEMPEGKPNFEVIEEKRLTSGEICRLVQIQPDPIDEHPENDLIMTLHLVSDDNGNRQTDRRVCHRAAEVARGHRRDDARADRRYAGAR